MSHVRTPEHFEDFDNIVSLASTLYNHIFVKISSRYLCASVCLMYL